MERAYAEQYSNYEEHHWWFRARRVILQRLLAKEVVWRPRMKVLEIGCGPGLNLYSLYPKDCELYGMEPDADNAGIAGKRGKVPVSVGTVESIAGELREKRFEVITMFDVLEHIQDDAGALKIVMERLVPGGYLVMTVPAYQWMWGQQDMVNLHFRRYTEGQLVVRLREAGFEIQRATYFNSLLFPPIAAVRLLARLFSSKDKPAKSDFEYSTGGLNEVLYHIFKAEAGWLERFAFPCGVSVFAVARRPKS
ncbi:MAG TPA: class I SAM-dependent methyltransferase [Verrucomicrobiae bacterium]